MPENKGKLRGFKPNNNQQMSKHSSNSSLGKKLLYMTGVAIVINLFAGLAAVELWKVFPSIEINGLSYMANGDLVTYYSLINLLNILLILILARNLYFKQLHTLTPFSDGVLLGIVLVVFSWIFNIIYMEVSHPERPLPDFIVGKNQPEIGIVWLTAIITATISGWLYHKRWKSNAHFWMTTLAVLAILNLVAHLLTMAGVNLFDIKP
jgi:hypothetical protein